MIPRVRLDINLISCVLQLENWSSSSSAKPGQKPEVDLLVPPGQLPIGEALIKAMYEKQPDLSALSQQQQLQLLQLADAYAVEKVAYVACSSLSTLSVDAIDWPTALAFLSLSASLDKLPPCKVLKATAARRLHQQLSDLDVIWTSCEQSYQQQQADQKLLLGLPCGALYQLLSLDALKVSSEDTVFYTISQWLQANPHTSTAEKQQLSQVLRLPHCTPTHLCNVMCSKDSWLRGCVPDEDLFRACALSNRAEGSLLGTISRKDKSASSLACNPVRELQYRLASAVRKCDIKWEVALADLEEKFGEALKSNSTTSLRSPAEVWQGRAFSLQLQFEKAPALKAPALRIGLYLMFEGAAASEVCVEARLRAMSGRSSRDVYHSMETCIQGGSGKGSVDLFGIGVLESWMHGRDQLERHGFIYGGHLVQVAGTVLELT